MKATKEILTTKQMLEEIKYECYRNGYNYDKTFSLLDNISNEEEKASFIKHMYEEICY